MKSQESLLVVLMFSVSSCFYSAKNAKQIYGVQKGEKYITQEGVYIHRDLDTLYIGDQSVDEGVAKNDADLRPLKKNSTVKVTRFKTTGNWPMTSMTRVFGKVKEGNNVYRNVDIGDIFLDPKKNWKKTDKYVKRKSAHRETGKL